MCFFSHSDGSPLWSARALQAAPFSFVLPFDFCGQSFVEMLPGIPPRFFFESPGARAPHLATCPPPVRIAKDFSTERGSWVIALSEIPLFFIQVHMS